MIPIKIGPSKEISQESGIEKVTFQSLQLTEANIEEFLRKNIQILFDDEDDDETLLIVGQQVVNLKGARNDLVALDGDGNLVLIEIKRDAADIISRSESMEFQAVRYAASLATITDIDDLVQRVFARYIKKWSNEFELGELTPEELGKRLVGKFLRDNDAEKSFNTRQRIILVSSSFDDQTLSAAAWMSVNGIDISCVSLNPIRSTGSTGPLYLSAERIVPVKKVEEYFVGFDNPTTITPDSSSGTAFKKTRRSQPRMPQLMEWGIVQKGMTLTLKGFEDSQAIVQDSNTVEFKGQIMPFNQWGLKVSGWSSISVYDWAVTPEGKTLSQLRADYMEKNAATQSSNHVNSADQS